jgi:hypothetical protein
VEVDRPLLEVTPRGFGARLAAALVAGAFLGAFAMVCGGWMLRAFAARLGAPLAAEAFREFLSAGAWLWFPLWGAAVGALFALPGAAAATQRWSALLLAALLASLPLLARPEVNERIEQPPRTPQAKMRSVLRWSYRTPETVSRILPLSHDPDPRVREHAVLALGINLIVTDIERSNPARPARYLNHPLRARLGTRLRECLTDSVEVIRAEAARVLWKAPRTFGIEPVAAETLAAILDRAARPDALERLSWLALDAAAGDPHPTLKSAAARFAAATPDPELRRVALEAAR